MIYWIQNLMFGKTIQRWYFVTVSEQTHKESGGVADYIPITQVP